MNCNDFEKIVNELAQYHLMEAGKKEQALQHTRDCSRCNSLLFNERVLGASLTLAANAETESAPGRVKANLLAAFAAQSKSSSTIVVPIYKKESSAFFWKWAVAAAIVIAILGIATMRLTLRSNNSELQQATKGAEIKAIEINNQKFENESPRTPPEKEKVNNVAKNNNPVNAPRRSGNKTVNPSAENANNNEVTSDFIALTYTDETSSTDSGMVVRVKLPRATLIAMGLPLNATQTGGYVKADLIVGDDGVARAIRLVQDSSSDTNENEK